MRQHYGREPELGDTPIESLKIPTKSRDELPPVLRALQYIYCTPELKDAIFSLLEKKITMTDIGTPGMSLWEILIIGVVRLTLDANYDRLEHIVNYDELVRGMLGIQKFGGEKKEYGVQTLRDNVYLLDETILKEINELLVEHGHAIKKKDNSEKGETESLAIKIDSYAVESNVHFPTDYNLLWDSVRKSLALTKQILEGHRDIQGWRKIGHWEKTMRNLFEQVRRSSHRGGVKKKTKLKSATRKYIHAAEDLYAKLMMFRGSVNDPMVSWKEWDYYVSMLAKHIDLTSRRILREEVIPHEEKVFSIFEPYTEWISKGKANRQVELGVKVAIATDQDGFILRHVVMLKQQDVDITVSLAKELLAKYSIDSISFDKGFWSKDNFEELQQPDVHIVLPKKGKQTKVEYEREHAPEFKKLRRRHSEVESNINALEHHGVNRCPDRGLIGFRRYVALGVLAYNLHKLGNLLLERDRNQKRAAA